MKDTRLVEDRPAGVTPIDVRAHMAFGMPVMVMRPETGEAALPAVLVLHEAWGLTPDIASAAERIAGSGLVAAAPDLASGPVDVAGLVAEIWRGDGPTIDLTCRLLDWVQALPAVSGPVGVVGFSMGGALGLVLDRHPMVAVISANYCVVSPTALRRRPVPVVASFGGRDRLLPRAERPLRRRLDEVGGVRSDVLRYEGAGHSFMTGSGGHRENGPGRLPRRAPHSTAADHAWDRTLGFLHSVLDPREQ